MNRNTKALEAFKSGQDARKLQDEILEMFIKHIQRITDVKTLQDIKKEMAK